MVGSIHQSEQVCLQEGIRVRFEGCFESNEHQQQKETTWINLSLYFSLFFYHYLDHIFICFILYQVINQFKFCPVLVYSLYTTYFLVLFKIGSKVLNVLHQQYFVYLICKTSLLGFNRNITWYTNELFVYNVLIYSHVSCRKSKLRKLEEINWNIQLVSLSMTNWFLLIFPSRNKYASMNRIIPSLRNFNIVSE